MPKGIGSTEELLWSGRHPDSNGAYLKLKKPIEGIFSPKVVTTQNELPEAVTTAPIKDNFSVSPNSGYHRPPQNFSSSRSSVILQSFFTNCKCSSVVRSVRSPKLYLPIRIVWPDKCAFFFSGSCQSYVPHFNFSRTPILCISRR